MMSLLFFYFFFFFNDTATTEIYTSLFVGSVSVYKRQDMDGSKVKSVRTWARVHVC